MRKILLTFSVLLIVLAALPSCKSAFETALKSKDVNERFTRANEFYEKKQWSKANQLYETLLPVFRGTKNYEELYWRYCHTFYNMQDYMSASYQFKNFTEIFSKSSRAEEAYFLYAVALYKMSPKYSLDQSSTIKAAEVLQTYINMYPSSSHLKQANTYIEQARKKLEEKDAHAARLYYHIGEYKAASVAYKTLMFDYPESVYSDYYQYMMIQAYFYYAKNSRTEKQEERYAEVINACNELQQNYPNSIYLKEANNYANSSQKIINKLRNEHQ